MARSSGLYVKKRAPGGAAAGRVMREEVRQDMVKVAVRVVLAHERVVSNWSSESRPSFGYRVTSGEKEVTLSVFVKNQKDSLPAKRWRMLDTEGRKGGSQIPKSGPRRMFFKRRHAKTGGSPARYGGSGNFYGPLISKMRVKQGAVEPRHFSEAIGEAADEEMSGAIRRGYRRAFRRIFGRSI